MELEGGFFVQQITISAYAQRTDKLHKIQNI